MNVSPGVRTIIGAILCAAGCGGGMTPAHLVLATTTSVGNSGLLDVLVPAWHRESSIEIRPVLVGSGRALRMLEEGQADLVISHAPEAEAAMMQNHAAAWCYRKIMYNDFVLAGPPVDRAEVRAAARLEDALRRIAESRQPFVSRGDESGTHERERALWKLVGVGPEPDELFSSGAGMAVTLRQASDLGAYTLTDRATFEQLKESLVLQIVWEHDSRLLNTYAAIVDCRGPRRADALAFSEWLVKGAGRDLIAAYRIRSSRTPAFTVWPSDGGHEPHSAPGLP